MNQENGIMLGAGFFQLMFLMFLGLKISGMIDWSWWWVFAPIWVPLLVIAAVIGIIAIVLAVTGKSTKG